MRDGHTLAAVALDYLDLLAEVKPETLAGQPFASTTLEVEVAAMTLAGRLGARLSSNRRGQAQKPNGPA